MADRLLDTNALSAVLRAEPAMANYLQGLRDARVATSVVVEGELRFGILRLPEGKRRKTLARALAAVLSSLDDLLPVTRAVSRRYARLRASMWSNGRPIGENDLWIAATALVGGLVLVTRDADLHGLPGLSAEGW